MTQKFKRGDLVKVADKMPKWMSHFKCGMKAYIQYSYADQYGGGNRDPEYSIMYEYRPGKWTSSAWYDEYQLTLVKKRTMKSIEFVEEQGRK